MANAVAYAFPWAPLVFGLPKADLEAGLLPSGPIEDDEQEVYMALETLREATDEQMRDLRQRYPKDGATWMPDDEAANIARALLLESMLEALVTFRRLRRTPVSLPAPEAWAMLYKTRMAQQALRNDLAEVDQRRRQRLTWEALLGNDPVDALAAVTMAEAAVQEAAQTAEHGVRDHYAALATGTGRVAPDPTPTITTHDDPTNERDTLRLFKRLARNVASADGPEGADAAKAWLSQVMADEEGDEEDDGDDEVDLPD